MSSNRRPWYKWYPKDFVVDEKVQCLSAIAELVYRRALDVMWQANSCQLPNVCQALANALSKGLPEDEFKKAWIEIQTPGFELFKTSEDDKWIYSSRLMVEMKACETIIKLRTSLGKKGGLAKAKAIGTAKAKRLLKQNGSNTDTDIKKVYKEKYGEFNNVFLSIDELEKLKTSFGDQGTKTLIEKLSLYVASNGKKYKSHYATILNWERKNEKDNPPVMSQKLKTYTREDVENGTLEHN